MKNNKILNAILFAALILFEIIVFALLVAQRRLVVHDSFMRFSMQYFFLNHTVQYHELPHWIPFMTHGRPAYFYIPIAGINSYLTNIFFYTRSLLADINFNVIFYFSTFFDKLLFLVGTWLLAKKYYRSSVTRFFVACSVISACVWTSQAYFNLYFVYTLPLMLYLLHAYLETDKSRYLCLCGCLFFFQVIGNLIYFIPILSLTVFMYFLVYLLHERQAVLKRPYPWLNRRLFLSLFIVLLAFLCVFYMIKISHDPQYVFNDPGRGADGTPSLEENLVYVNMTPFGKWIEVLWGFSLERDYTLYSGLLLLPLCVVAGLANRNKYSVTLLVVSVFFYLYSTNYFVNAFFFYWWPFIKFYRHHHLVVIIVRVLLCFLAGFGFEYLFLFHKEKKRGPAPFDFYLLAGALFVLTGFFFYISNDYHRMVDFIRGAGFEEFVMPENNKEMILDELVRNFRQTGMIATIFGICFLFFARVKKPKQQTFLLFAVLVLHAVDVQSYGLQENLKRTIPLSQEAYQTLHFAKYDFQKKRQVEFFRGSPREKVVSDDLLLKGASYWTLNAFTANDQLGTSFRTVFWLKPFNEYLLNACNGSIRTEKLIPDCMKRGELKFPLDDMAALKISAHTAEKIQFFSRPHSFSDKNVLASYLRDKRFTGDLLFVEDENRRLALTDQALSAQDLSSPTRLNVSYDILEYTANRLKLDVQAPAEPVWLMYSDVWHPYWAAKINHKEAPVYKAHLAYKAVPLSPGENIVEFYFQSRLFSFLFAVIAVQSLIVLGLTLFYAGFIFSSRDMDSAYEAGPAA